MIFELIFNLLVFSGSTPTRVCRILADWAVFITGEGDNMPLAQQNARFLMSAVRKIAAGRGDALKGTSVQYLHDGFAATGMASFHSLAFPSLSS
jgi:hypothetical protein